MLRFFLLIITFGLISCAPMAKFSYTQDSDIAPAEVRFENESKKAETYRWYFGDGQESTDENPNHHYHLSGKYTVKLEASAQGKTNSYSEEVFFKAPETCLVIIETSYGKITLELFDSTPKHRDNFIRLVEEGYYDGSLFHRVIEGFMIQGGDPDSKEAKPGAALGRGGPGYVIPAEIMPENVHVKGALAAARMGDAGNPERNSSGSQFYIVDGTPVDDRTLDNLEMKNGIRYTDEQRIMYRTKGGTPFLDMQYTVFGQVTEGFEVVEMIAKAAKDNRDRPQEDIVMTVRIIK